RILLFSALYAKRVDGIDRPSTRLECNLFTQSQFFDDLFVTGSVFFLEIGQVAAAFAHHLEQTATRVIIMFMHFQMFDQLVNPRRQQGDLNFWGTSIAGMNMILTHNGCLFSLFERHSLLLLYCNTVLKKMSQTAAPLARVAAPVKRRRSIPLAVRLSLSNCARL